jgi:hypothetical protein
MNQLELRGYRTCHRNFQIRNFFIAANLNRVSGRRVLLVQSRKQFRLFICLCFTLAEVTSCHAKTPSPPVAETQNPLMEAQARENQKPMFRCGKDDDNALKIKPDRLEFPKIDGYHTEFESPVSTYSRINRDFVERKYLAYNKFRDQVIKNQALGTVRGLQKDLITANQLYDTLSKFDDSDPMHMFKARGGGHEKDAYDLSSLYHRIMIQNAFLLYFSQRSSSIVKLRALKTLRDKLNLSDPFLRMYVSTSKDPLQSQAIAFALFLNKKYETAYRTRLSLMAGLAGGGGGLAPYHFQSLAPTPETLLNSSRNNSDVNEDTATYLSFSNNGENYLKYSDSQLFKGTTCNLKTAIDAQWIILANAAATANSDRVLRESAKERANTMIGGIEDLNLLLIFNDLKMIAIQNP